MSTEILEIVQQMDLHNAETQLALQCAPLIAGVKISNLLVVSTGMEDAVKQCLRKSGISFLLLSGPGKKLVTFFFGRNRWRRI